MESLYDVLGITAEEKRLSGKEFNDVVKRNYREFAMKWHPDKYQDPVEKAKAEETFKKGAEAKEVLSDEQKRYQYDMTGSTSGFNYSNFNTHADLDDIINQFMNSRGSFHFGFNQRPEQKQYKGEDVTIRIVLDIKDVYNGCTKKYKYKRNVVCSGCGGGSVETCRTCNGTGMITTTNAMGGFGFVQQTSFCPHCRGMGKIVQTNSCKRCNNTGFETKEEIVSVDIPKGVTEGNILKKNGGGHDLPKQYSGIPGDLQIIISKINSGSFQVDKYNLVIRKQIPILDIITGTKFDLITPLGKSVKIDVPQNFSNGNSMQLSGYGLPIGNTGRVGDIYIIIDHKFPTTLDKNDIKYIDELKKSKNFK